MLFQQVQAAMAANDWREAAKLNGQLKAADPAFPVQPETERAIKEHLRMLDVADGIAQAQRVASDTKQCDQPKAIADAWTKLKETRSTDSQWSAALAAVAQLETCRKNIERELSAGMRQIMIAQREAWAEKADRTFLDQGMNVAISLDGANKDHVTLKWALMSRAAAHKLTDAGSLGPDSFLGSLQKIGFMRVTFSDGFDEAWSYKLHPEDESSGGTVVLAEHGIGAPLRLTR